MGFYYLKLFCSRNNAFYLFVCVFRDPLVYNIFLEEDLQIYERLCIGQWSLDDYMVFSEWFYPVGSGFWTLFRIRNRCLGA